MPAADNSQPLSRSVAMGSEDPSNSIEDSLEFAYPPAPRGRLHDSVEIGQQSNGYVDASFNSQAVNSHLSSQHHFFDTDISNVHCGYPLNLEPPGLYDNEYGAPSMEHHSFNAYGCEAPFQDNDGLSVPVSDMPQQMDWTNDNQGVMTVNPQDLMLYSFPLTATTLPVMANITQEPC